MNDDPTQVNVLYAKLYSEGDILQEIADKIVDYISETGKSFRLHLLRRK